MGRYGGASGCQVRTGGLATRPLRRQRVHTQMRREEPFTRARTRRRLGVKRLAVTLWAWLTLRPWAVPLSQISQRLAIVALSLPPAWEAGQSRQG